jgi:hypothetical protein
MVKFAKGIGQVFQANLRSYTPLAPYRQFPNRRAEMSNEAIFRFSCDQKESHFTPLPKYIFAVIFGLRHFTPFGKMIYQND